MRVLRIATANSFSLAKNKPLFHAPKPCPVVAVNSEDDSLLKITCFFEVKWLHFMAFGGKMCDVLVLNCARIH